MENSAATTFVIAQARARGPLVQGSYRVVVIEPNGTVSSQDYPTLEEAAAYADDAAAENSDDDRPVAKVVDASFQLVHEGKPYWLR